MSKQNINYTPRLSIELTDEQRTGLDNINLPWGWQRRIFSVIVDELIFLNLAYGPEAIACVAARVIDPREAISTLSNIASTGQKLMEDEDDNVK